MKEEEYRGIIESLLNGNHLEPYEILKAVKFIHKLNKELERRL